MRWLSLLLFPLWLHAQVSIRDPAYLAKVGAATSSGPPVSGYTMWIDPSDTTTLFTNSQGTVSAQINDIVRRINDKSPSGTNFLNQSFALPGFPYLATNVFFNSGTGLTVPCMALGHLFTSNLTSLGVLSGTGAVTMFIVGRGSNTMSDGGNLVDWSIGSYGWDLRYQSGVMQMFTAPSFPFLNGPAFSKTSNWVWCLQMDRTLGASSYFNFWTGYTKTANTVTSDLIPINQYIGLGKIANYAVNANAWGCYWGEFLAYPRLLTGAEVTNTMNYLIPKWGTRSGP